MNLRHRTRTRSLESTDTSLDNAWRLHDAQMDWTGKVDAKAAFSLTIQGVLLAASVSLLDEVNTCIEYVLLGLGVVLVLAGVTLAASVVAPRLRTKDVAREMASNFIYFGHARGWSADRLVRELRRTDLTVQLARQVVVMADIAWDKHRRVGWSIWLAVAGGVLLLAAGAATKL